MECLSKNVFIKLNEITIKILSIFSKNSYMYFNRHFIGGMNDSSSINCDLTLFELIARYNCTLFGRRLWHFWLSHPLRNVEKMNKDKNLLSREYDIGDENSNDIDDESWKH